MKAEQSTAVSLTIEKNEFKNIKEILNQPILNLNLSNNDLSTITYSILKTKLKINIREKQLFKKGSFHMKNEIMWGDLIESCPTKTYCHKDYNWIARDILSTHGNRKIIRMYVIIKPIRPFLRKGFNVLSLGKLNEPTNYYSGITLCHWKLAITLELDSDCDDKITIILEKTFGITLTAYTNTFKEEIYTADTNTVLVDIPIAGKRIITINELLEKTRERFANDDKFFNVSFYYNNCQKFVSVLLKESNLYPAKLDIFKQYLDDDKEIAKVASCSLVANILYILLGRIYTLIYFKCLSDRRITLSLL